MTNKPDFLTTPLLNVAGFPYKPHCVISGDTCRTSKPSPEPLLHACKQLNIQPEETLFVGDNQCDVQAAKQAHMAVVVVKYGYLMPDDQILDWHADFYVDEITDIISLIN